MHVLRSALWRLRLVEIAFLSGSVGFACAGSREPPRPAEPSGPPAAPEPSHTATAAEQAPASGAVAPGEPCGALDCRRFPDAMAALRYVLSETPLALGIGEAHAQAGSEHIVSTARRFSEQLLPLLSGRSSHLIVELLNRNPECVAAARPLEQAQKPVIASQSHENQSDYVALGTRARALGIEPFLLTPSCDEFQAIADAEEDAIPRTLATIAAVTLRVAKGALVQNRKAGSDQIVVAYGGALHNDRSPSATRASFRYGDALEDFTGGRYIALDLIVREFIRDNDVWRALPWYGQFDPTLYPESSVLLQPEPHSYVLFFPSSSRSAAAAPAAAP